MMQSKTDSTQLFCVIEIIFIIFEKIYSWMETKYIKDRYIEGFPLEERIKDLPRGITLKIEFEDKDEPERNKIGEFLKEKFSDFLIGIDTTEKEINISRLITDKEVEENIDFFTKCAKDYDLLASSLINALISKLDIELNINSPIESFNRLKRSDANKGEINGWRYYLHGFHCGFTNIKSGQTIEASLICGDIFGELDPYFFSDFILSTKEYQPLPVKIYHKYHDGVKVLNVMEKLRALKLIESNWSDRYGYVLANKNTSHIKPYVLEEVEPEKKFDVLRFLKLKK